mgnify:CR=1 FL=1
MGAALSGQEAAAAGGAAGLGPPGLCPSQGPAGEPAGPCCRSARFSACRSDGSAGRPDARRDDAELFAFERTSQLVSSGIFRYIRHPLYCSLLLLAWGICWKQANGLTVGLALFASLMLYLTAKRDEAECLAYFGDKYRAYMARSKMFVPYLF